ncbi:hypothetical protein AB0J38_27210 [Streptomyces sp. NPDC050095]|uniref:hypothetical protein n=1 Tax=unclassified Streptomyces TaxID=2593676 RepID=UPI00344AA2DE
MFEYEIHQVRSAQLIQEADDYRLARSARAAAKAARRAGRSGGQGAEGRVSTNGLRRHRAAHTA